MNIRSFFKLGSLSQLAKLVNRSVSTIRRWKRKGIPKRLRKQVKEIIEPTIVPLTPREKRQQQEQKRLALQEQKRLQSLRTDEKWEKEFIQQQYTQNRIVAIFTAIEQNRIEIIKAGPKRKRRIKLAVKIGQQMLRDYANGERFINSDLILPLMAEYNLDEHEAFQEIYGY